jgi:GIY-YIG catalytic domain
MEFRFKKHLDSLQALIQWAFEAENCPEEAKPALLLLRTIRLDLEQGQPSREPDFEAKWPARHIYALVDPRDETIHYIGQTSNPKARLSGHFSGFSAGSSQWVEKLRGAGFRPIFHLLETCEGNVDLREQYWIRACLLMGEPIENTLK